jgi:hypothetical protein
MMASTRVRQIGLACTLIVLWVTAGPAEQRLQNVAGSITLKRPAGEQLVIVEPEEQVPGARMGATGSELIELSGQLLEGGRAASTVLDESRSGLTFFDPAWRRRMLDALAEIDTTRFSLELVEAPERYADALDRVVEGAREYQLAAGIVRWAILRDRPVFSKAFDHMRGGERELGFALAGLRREAGVEGNEAAAPGIDPFTAGQSMTRACRAYCGATQGADYDRCMERQQAALLAIERRFSFNAHTDERAFNSIRSRCRDEFPGDFVGRDRCERQAIAGVTGGLY